MKCFPTGTELHRVARLSVLSAVLAGLTACASGPLRPGVQAEAPRHPAGAEARLAQSDGWLAESLAAWRSGAVEQAQARLQDGLNRHPRSGAAHLLLAATHQIQGDDANLELAGAGYTQAQRFGADVFWPSFMGGLTALQRQQAAEALPLLAEAVMADPARAAALEAMAAAAYLQGEFGLALEAAQAALSRDPAALGALRVATLSAAALGDEAQVRAHLALMPTDLRAWAAPRSAQLLRTATATAPSPSGTPPSRAATAHPEQLSVDVVLILADGRSGSSTGVNLLDGLRLSYGAERVSSSGAGSASITRTLRIPELSYSLNIANRSARRYQMAARPSLTSFVGQPSQFFVGEQLVVQTSGVNVAQLERIDVGVRLQVTPSEVRPDGARFRIEADRSFLSDVPAGSFREQLSIFKQSVSATADLRYGETLVISGLQEQVSDYQDSKVPVLGDIPGPNLLFSQSAQRDRQRSVLVLVTPAQPLAFASSDAPRARAVQRLIELWDQVIDPTTQLGTTLQRLQRRAPAARVVPGDVAFPTLSDAPLRQAFLDSVAQQLRVGAAGRAPLTPERPL